MTEGALGGGELIENRGNIVFYTPDPIQQDLVDWIVHADHQLNETLEFDIPPLLEPVELPVNTCRHGLAPGRGRRFQVGDQGLQHRGMNGPGQASILLGGLD